MTKFTSFARACRSYFAGSAVAPLRVSLSDQNEAQMARCGQSSAMILHSKLSGFYYA